MTNFINGTTVRTKVNNSLIDHEILTTIHNNNRVTTIVVIDEDNYDTFYYHYLTQLADKKKLKVSVSSFKKEVFNHKCLLKEVIYIASVEYTVLIKLVFERVSHA